MTRPDPLTPGGYAESGVQVDRGAAGVLTVAFDQPTEWAPATWRTLAGVGRQLTGDVRVVVVRITGALPEGAPDGGPGGAVTDGCGALSEEACESALDDCQDAFRWLRRNDVISIGVLSGAVTGHGVAAALCCDLRLLAADGSLALTGTVRGLVPALTATGPLVDLIGVARATELCVTGRRVHAAEAQRLGLATCVVPVAELPAATDALVEGLCAVPRQALAETKALLAGATGRSRAEQEAAERAALGRRLREVAGVGE